METFTLVRSAEVKWREDILMRVCITPGAYAFTVMPYFPNSEASRVNKFMNHGGEPGG